MTVWGNVEAPSALCFAHSSHRGPVYKKQLLLQRPSAACELKVTFLPLLALSFGPIVFLCDHVSPWPPFGSTAAVAGRPTQRRGVSSRRGAPAAPAAPCVQPWHRHAAGPVSGG